MKYLLVLMLLIPSLGIVGQDCEKFVTGQYVPTKQLEGDSVFYLISLSKFIEFHKNKEYHKTYKLKWFTPCSFEMELDKIFDGDQSREGEEEKITCSAKVINDSTLSINMNNIVQTVQRYSKNSIWELMM